MSKMAHFSERMPVRNDDPEEWSLEEDDWWYDDGDIWAMFSVVGDEAVIHEFSAHDPDKQGARTGIGRTAVRSFRENFKTVTASGVGDDHPQTISQHPAFRFWRKMLEDGLIDGIITLGRNSSITREMLAHPIETGYGVIYPDPEAYDPKPMLGR